MAKEPFEVKPFFNQLEHTIVETLYQMSAQGLLTFDEETRKFKLNAIRMDKEAVYLFFNKDRKGECRTEDFSGCMLNWDILHNRFKVKAPSYCQDHCWKVIANLHNVYELIRAYDMLDQISDLYGKCGMDERDYTTGMPKIFIYASSLEDADDKRRKLSTLLKRHINITIEPYIKRGCTEFEAAMPSNKWAYNEEEKKFEDLVKSFIDPKVGNIIQPDWLINLKKIQWCREANRIGDLSYQKLPGLEGITLGVVSVKYEYNRSKRVSKEDGIRLVTEQERADQ